MLRCKRAPLRLRLALLNNGVRDVLLWGSGAAYLRGSDVADIRSVQRAMTARLLRFVRPEGQPEAVFFADRNRLTTRIMAWGGSDWGQAALLRHFSAAGEAARQGRLTVLGQLMQELPAPTHLRGEGALPLSIQAVGRWAHRWDMRAWGLLTLPQQFVHLRTSWTERRLGGFQDWKTLAQHSDLWAEAALTAAPTSLPVRR